MAFTDSKPASADDINTAINSYTKDNFTHIKSSITAEHDWSNSTAASCTHDEGSGRIWIAATGDAPTPKLPKGGLWYDTTADKLYYDNGTAWVEVDIGGSYLKLSGGTMAADIAMGGNKVTGLASGGTGTTDACTVSQAESLIGAGGSHAASHTDGTDDIQAATDSVKGVMTAADHTIFTHINNTIRYIPLHWDYTVDGGETAPAVGISNGFRVAAFSTSADNTLYLSPVFNLAGGTSAYLHVLYNMSSDNAGTVSLNIQPYIDGVAGVADAIVLTNGAADPNHNGDSLYHYIEGTNLLIKTGLTGKEIIAIQMWRDVSADTHTGSFVLLAAWLAVVGS